MPDGMCVTRTADSVLLTCWPPAPLERSVSILRSVSLMATSRSCASGSTATVAVEVWIRPEPSVSGTRCTRWTPDFGDNFLKAAHRPFANADDFDLPTLLDGIALVHAEQITSKNRSFVAAGAGADFKNDVAFVHRIFRQQGEPQLLLERGTQRLDLRPFRFGNRAHFGVGCRIGNQRRQVRHFPLRGAVGLDRFDDGSKFGKLPRQFHISLRRQGGCKVTLQCSMPRDKGIEFLVG